MKKRKLNKKGKILIFIIFIIISIIIYHIIDKYDNNIPTNDNIKSQNNVLDKISKNTKIIDDKNLRDGEEVIGTTDKGFKITKLNDVTYIDGVLIVNKTYGLPSTYEPINPYKEITNDYLYGADYIEDYVMNEYLKMNEDAKKEGINLKITSGYRSYNVQVDLYNEYKKRDGKEAADKYSARAGHSEHQSGLCFDLNGTNEKFIETKEGKWLNDNAYKYGFALRFPEGATKYTGYIYEGWHFRYVGVDLATKLYNDGNWISLEEYFGITSEYQD